MIRSRLNPKPTVLLWAIKRARVDLRRRFPRLDDWLSGTVQPTLRQLEDFAKAASMPFGYLFLPKPSEDRWPIPHFRSLWPQPKKRPSPDLLETIYIMQRRQSWMREYLIEQGHEPLPFVPSGSIREYTGPGEVAQRIRVVLGVDANLAASQQTWRGALRSLQKQAEAAGILVVTSSVVGNNTRRKLDVEEFRGFVLVDEYAPLVFINGADGKAAQMFTFSHELAHVWLGSSASFDLRNLHPAQDRTEEACNQIAAEFLVPANSIRDFWRDVKGRPDPLQLAANQFKVSEIVAARRALYLGLISWNEFREFYEKYRQRERIRSGGEEGGNFYAAQNLRLGRRFGEAVVRAVREGRLLYDEAYHLTGLYGRTFNCYAKFVAGDR